MSSEISHQTYGHGLKWQRYPAYRDSGLKWFWEVPEEWEVIKFKWSLSRLESGSRETGGGNQLINGIFSIGGEHIGWLGELLLDNPKYVSEDYYQRLNSGKIRTDDVLLVKDGATIGKCTIIKNLPFEKCAVNEHVFILRPNQDYNSKYIFYFLWSAIGQEQINNQIRGSAQPGLNSQFINTVFVPKPSIQEQETITTFLNRETECINTLIVKKERQIELLQEKRTALINHAVTKGLDPDVKMKDSEVEWLGEVPVGWEVTRLKYISTVNDETLSETTDLDYELVYVDISSVDPVSGIKYKEPMTFENAPSRARRKVRHGDVIISTVRTYLRAISPINLPEPNMIVSTGFAVVHPKEGMESQFAAHVFHAPYFVERVVANSEGVSYPAINASELITFYVALPPLTEQRTIAAFLECETGRIDTLTTKVRDSISKLHEYRTALISAAVTGKIDVRHEAV